MIERRGQTNIVKGQSFDIFRQKLAKSGLSNSWSTGDQNVWKFSAWLLNLHLRYFFIILYLLILLYNNFLKEIEKLGFEIAFWELEIEA